MLNYDVFETFFKAFETLLNRAVKLDPRIAKLHAAKNTFIDCVLNHDRFTKTCSEFFCQGIALRLGHCNCGNSLYAFDAASLIV